MSYIARVETIVEVEEAEQHTRLYVGGSYVDLTHEQRKALGEFLMAPFVDPGADLCRYEEWLKSEGVVKPDDEDPEADRRIAAERAAAFLLAEISPVVEDVLEEVIDVPTRTR